MFTFVCNLQGFYEGKICNVHTDISCRFVLEIDFCLAFICVSFSGFA